MTVAWLSRMSCLFVRRDVVIVLTVPAGCHCAGCEHNLLVVNQLAGIQGEAGLREDSPVRCTLTNCIWRQEDPPISPLPPYPRLFVCPMQFLLVSLLWVQVTFTIVSKIALTPMMCYRHPNGQMGLLKYNGNSEPRSGGRDQFCCDASMHMLVLSQADLGPVAKCVYCRRAVIIKALLIVEIHCIGMMNRLAGLRHLGAPQNGAQLSTQHGDHAHCSGFVLPPLLVCVIGIACQR